MEDIGEGSDMLRACQQWAHPEGMLEARDSNTTCEAAAERQIALLEALNNRLEAALLKEKRETKA